MMAYQETIVVTGSARESLGYREGSSRVFMRLTMAVESGEKEVGCG